jgi:hypothetical protein
MASELSLNAMVTLLNPASAIGRGPGRLAILAPKARIQMSSPRQ